MSSFREEYRQKGGRSRTPERPVVEPLRELEYNISELLKAPPRPTQLPRPPKRTRNGAKKSTAKATTSRHNHSNSNSGPPQSPLDALASAAMFEARSPQFFQYSPDLHAFSQQYDRPSKRARSEAIPSPMHTSPLFGQGTTRPLTSYNGWGYNVEQGIASGHRIAGGGHVRSGSASVIYAQPDAGMDEAELLLNFSRGGGSSAMRGLGIFAPATGPADNQRLPALPPFPFGTSDRRNGEVPTRSSNSQLAAYTMPPLAGGESSQLAASSSSQGHGTREPGEMLPTATGHPLPNGGLDDPRSPIASVHAQHIPNINGIPLISETVKTTAEHDLQEHRFLPTGSEATESDSRRFSDSMHNHVSRASNTKSSTNAGSPIADDVMSETPEVDMTSEDPKTDESPLRLHEQGVVCPGCKFAADTMSEKVDWLQCDGCDQWYHAACTGIPAKQSERIDKFFCKACVPKFGKSTCECLHGVMLINIDVRRRETKVDAC